MKGLLLVRHGPELRLLDAILASGRYSDIVLLVDSNAAPEVKRYVDGKLQSLIYHKPKLTRLSRNAAYLSALMDSLARRINRKRGIGHYSYAKRSNLQETASGAQSLSINKITLFSLDAALRILAVIASFLFRDRPLREILRGSGCGVLLACDHLGGSDAVAYNAQRLGLQIHYYLNNHKDLSIRPYVPLPANRMFSWFDSQKAAILDVCGSHRKLLAIGLFRAGPLLRSVSGHVRKASDGVVRVLHCCADARRRPHEVQSLIRIFELVRQLRLPVRFTLRQNPMGPVIEPALLSGFNFVDVVSHGWHWDEAKFLNFPDAAAEANYGRQLADHDIVSALPSTTLVEGYFFNKPTICLLDQSSPDAEAEREELHLCIPQCVLTSGNSAVVRSPKEYLVMLMELNRAN